MLKIYLTLFLFPLKMKSLELLLNFYWKKKEILWAKIEANVSRGEKLKRWSRLAGEQTMAYEELCIHLWFQSLRRSWVVTILNVHFNYKKSRILCHLGSMELRGSEWMNFAIRLEFKVWICHDIRQLPCSPLYNGIITELLRQLKKRAWQVKTVHVHVT